MTDLKLETSMQTDQLSKIQSERVSIQEHISYIQRLVAHGGPCEADYAEFDAWIRQIHSLWKSGQLSDQELAALRAAFGPSISLETMQGLTFIKPHGYAGDYEIIDRIYQYYICPLHHLSAWDRYMQQHAAPLAVRNRKSYFHSLLDSQIPDKAPLQVLKVASGPGRSMFEYLTANPTAEVNFDCIEIDPNAIEYASELNHAFLDRITFQQKNVLRFRPHQHEYDLVWAAGLFDYFADNVFASVLQRLLYAVAPNGELVIGNFSDQNPSRPYMELFDWNLYHRSAEQLISLAKSVGVPQERISVHSEPLGVNLFLHIRMP